MDNSVAGDAEPNPFEDYGYALTYAKAHSADGVSAGAKKWYIAVVIKRAPPEPGGRLRAIAPPLGLEEGVAYGV